MTFGAPGRDRDSHFFMRFCRTHSKEKLEMFLQSRTKSFPRSLAVLNHLCVDGVYLSVRVMYLYVYWCEVIRYVYTEKIKKRFGRHLLVHTQLTNAKKSTLHAYKICNILL